MMKRILVIGAAAYQVPAIRRIREMGYEAFCVDYKEGQPGYEFANGYRIIDVKDKQNCLAYAQDLGIDGVMTWGSTLTQPTVSFIASQMGLPCLSEDTANLSMSKYQICKCLAKAGLNSAGPVFELHNWEEVKDAQFSVPFVVKPSDGSGSKGVRIVEKETDIKEALQYAFDGARNNEIYVEPFIKGIEYSAEAFACNGEIYVNTIIRTEFHWLNNYPVYKQTTFLGLASETELLIEQEVIKAAKALNVTMGPVNFDIIVSESNGKPHIIDVGIRNGQNLIASHIVPYSRGVDALNCLIKLCLGEETEAKPCKKTYISSRLLIYEPGLIEDVKPLAGLIGHGHIVDIILRKKAGECLPRYETKADICGWVLTEGETPELASQYADEAWETLKNYIIVK